MTDILCTWLNEELKLSKRITALTFAADFNTGYLIGEVLHKNGLQDDFDQFSVAQSNEARLNNFTRVEPSIHLLGIPFDTNVARDIMTEISGVSTRLLYQMFIALKQKQKANLTGTAIETMRPAGPVKLETIGSELYKERLRHITPRQTDVDLEALQKRFYQHKLKMEATAFKERFEEQERIRKRHEDDRLALIERSRVAKAKQIELLAKIEAATVEIPKPPPQNTAKALAKKRQLRIAREARDTMESIWQFEERTKAGVTPTYESGDQEQKTTEDPNIILEEPEPVNDSRKPRVIVPLNEADLIKPTSNEEYIGKIKKRLQEDASARAEREKRRRKVLVDQLKAHESMEDARREEILVNRLMRQSQQERRIAVQLMQTRREKDVFRNNRIRREKEHEERRTRDFCDALDREAEMARLAKIEYAEQTLKDREMHEAIAAERAIAKYRKHYDMCYETVNSLVDFTCKVAEYRELTEDLVPAKLYREWTQLFTNDEPLYEIADLSPSQPEEITPETVLEEERQLILDEGDFTEYKEMIGEWAPPDESGIAGPPHDNPIVGHIVQRLYNMVYPPTPPALPPIFPPFPIRACVVGKFFSGKSTCCKALLQNRRLQILWSDKLLEEAIEAYKNNEECEEPEPAFDEVKEVAAANVLTPAVSGAVIANPATIAADTNKLQDAQPQMDEKKDEGTEKSDPEKPVVEVEKREASDASPLSSKSVKSSKSLLSLSASRSSTKPLLTVRAQLGGKAMKLLKKGKPVDDQILIDILTESIRNVPNETGWILDGFPTTYAQAKLLEKALSGYDADAVEETAKVEKVKKPAKTAGKKPVKSVLAPDPRPPPPPPDHVSSIDVVVLVDTPDHLCMRRSAGRYDAVQEGEVYHQEFKPPPEGSATGVGRQEKVIPVHDLAHDQDQVQQRLTGFQDAWLKMEKWYNMFGILRKVDGGLDANALYLEVEKVLDDTLARLQKKPEEESLPVEVSEKTEEPPVEPPVPEPVPVETPPPPPEPIKEEGKRARSGAKKSRSGSRSSSKEKDIKSSKKGDKTPSPKRSGSGEKAGKGSRGSTGKKGKKKTPEPEPEPVVIPEEPTGPPPPLPGSEEWEFVDQPITLELADVLAPYWEGTEDVYINTSKSVFRCLRTEREAIIRYFYQIRQDFLAYLRRPDHKNEFVIQWQKDYNAVSDDLREDEETKCELHNRVDDLRERLWSICDERKQQAEEERGAVIEDGWLDDRLGVLSNYFISIMQVELDRLQDTMRLLKDYYKGMEGHIPDEAKEEFARIPLVELPQYRPPSAQADDSAFVEVSPKESVRKESAKSTSSSTRKSRQSKEAEDAPEETTEKKHRIPLVPRRPPSTDGQASVKDKKDKKVVKKDRLSASEMTESPPTPQDPDERLISDAYWTGINAVSAMLNAEIAVREAEEAAEKEKEEKLKNAKPPVVDKAKKGGKKGGKKSRSPSPKKGKGKEPEPVAPPPQEEVQESEEEKQKKLLKKKMREEMFFAFNEEGEACKVRLSLIRIHANNVLHELKIRAENTFKDMNDWLGARFLKEMESIDQLSELMRNAVEKAEKITYEVLLQQEDFIVADDVKVVRSPSPPPLIPPIEQARTDQFTVNQLLAMYNQFSLIAPEGIMSMKAFIDSLQDLANLTQGTELIPEAWASVTPTQLQEVANSLSHDGVYVNWRGFLVAVSQPSPKPTQTDLLHVLAECRHADQEETGYLTLEEFLKIELWFSIVTPPGTPVRPYEMKAYNRLAALKLAYFDFFAEYDREPPGLNYLDMLIYFAVDADPFEGFLRALSVATGHEMPRSHKIKDEQLVCIVVDDQTTVEPTPEAHETRDADVPLNALLKVLHHGERTTGDSHRFSVSADPEDAFSKERLHGIYQDLGGVDCETVPFHVLMEHPVIQDRLVLFNRFKTPDLKSILTNVTSSGADLDPNSARTSE